MWRGHKAFQLTRLLSAILGLVTFFEPARASENDTKCCAELDARLEELASTVLADAAIGELLSADLSTNKLEVWGTLAQTEVRGRGFGIEQAFDQIGLLVYAQAHFYDAKISGYPCNSNFLPKVCGVNVNELTVLPTLPWDAFVAGARIRF